MLHLLSNSSQSSRISARRHLQFNIIRRGRCIPPKKLQRKRPAGGGSAQKKQVEKTEAPQAGILPTLPICGFIIRLEGMTQSRQTLSRVVLKSLHDGGVHSVVNTPASTSLTSSQQFGPGGFNICVAAMQCTTWTPAADCTRIKNSKPKITCRIPAEKAGCAPPVKSRICLISV